MHSVYGGAHLFKADSAAKIGAVALSVLEEYAPDARTFAAALGLAPDEAALAETIRARVVDKLTREPVEDFRIDFEDGYGIRPDAEEDGHARSVAEEVAAGLAAGTLPPFIGIRIKPMSKELHARSLRTLDLFVTTLARAAREPSAAELRRDDSEAHGPRPRVGRRAAPARRSSGHLKLRPGAIALELMIETPQSILAADGSSSLRALVAAGGGRVRGAHFGTYDYTALCGITASWQHMRHAACDFAKHMMQVALAQGGVWLSDGATNIMPVPPHRAGPTVPSQTTSAARTATSSIARGSCTSTMRGIRS